MLTYFEPSDDEINRWVESISNEFGLPFRRLNYNEWQLDLRNPEAAYTINIFDLGEWVSYAVVLLDDVQGKKLVTFYRDLLELNAQLNGIKVGREGDKLILSSEDTKVGLNVSLFYQSIALMDRAFQIVFPLILEQIKALGLRLIT